MLILAAQPGAYGLPEGMNFWPILGVAILVGATTFLTRALPFVAVSFMKNSTFLAYLGRVMPLGVVTILLIYALLGERSHPGGLWAVCGAAVCTALVYVWRHSSGIAILTGTAVYVVLVNWVFS